MGSRTTIVVSIAVLATAATPVTARAHELWLEPSGQTFVLRYGHRGGEQLPITASKVTSIRCRDGQASARDVLGKATFQPTVVSVAASCRVISATFHGGFWVLTPDGERNVPRTQAPNAVKSWESRELTKYVDAHSPLARLPIGDELEIVPVTDLSTVRAGDKVTVRVLLNGSPTSGAVVGYGEKPIGETDSAGETRVRLREAGLQLLTATLRRSLQRPEADTLMLQANLAFEAGK